MVWTNIKWNKRNIKVCNVVIASILNIGNEELTKIYFSKSPDAIVEYKER